MGKHKDARPTVRIYSNGTDKSTIIVGPDGVQLVGVVGLETHIDMDTKTLMVTLDIVGCELDVNASVEIINLRCPLCHDSQEHRCQT